jgi:ribosomal protein S18 acetylase RimI-like enzyme
MGNNKIREITDGKLDTSVAIIRRAFGTVADEMGYTEVSVPVFPAFITVEKLKVLKARGAVFFGLFIDGKQIGFVAVEKENDGKYYMKRLAVLPEFRHGGYGREMVNHVIEYVKNKGNNKLHITIVDDNPVLKKWYLEMGFKETSVQKFEHLLFMVSFMELDIGLRKSNK